MRDDELRSLGPPELSPHRKAALRAQVLSQIEPEAATSDAPVVPMRRRRFSKRTIGVIAAAAITLSACAAAALATSRTPGSADVDVVIQRAIPDLEAHIPGWRPLLKPERVVCLSADSSPSFEGFASEFDMVEALTREHLVATCASKATEWSEDPSTVAAAPAVCADRSADLVLPTVPLGGSDCAAVGMDELSDDDLVALNDARAMEATLLAFTDPCPSRADAERWVREQIDSYKMPLRIVTQSPPPSAVPSDEGTCYRGFVYWETSTVMIDPYIQPS